MLALPPPHSLATISQQPAKKMDKFSTGRASEGQVKPLECRSSGTQHGKFKRRWMLNFVHRTSRQEL
jgi:hypothetical protein